MMTLFVGVRGLPLAEANQLIRIEKALQEIFPGETEFVQESLCLSPEEIRHIEQKADIVFEDTHASTIIRFTARLNGEVVGYAFEDIVDGKWGPIHYVAGVSLDGRVLGLAVLDYEEIRGRPIAKKRFLKQYLGKTTKDPLRLRKDIDGVTGATISSRAFTDGVRKILFIFQEIEIAGSHVCKNS